MPKRSPWNTSEKNESVMWTKTRVARGEGVAVYVCVCGGGGVNECQGK